MLITYEQAKGVNKYAKLRGQDQGHGRRTGPVREARQGDPLQGCRIRDRDGGGSRRDHGGRRGAGGPAPGIASMWEAQHWNGRCRLRGCAGCGGDSAPTCNQSEEIMTKLLITTTVAAALITAAPASGHLIAHHPKNTKNLRLIEGSQTRNLAHAKYVCANGAGKHKRWSCHATKWLTRELNETWTALHPPVVRVVASRSTYSG